MTKMPSLNRRGFTLIEMMVVIAIIGILAGLLFPAIGKALESAKRNKAGVEARAIAAAIDLFFNDHGYLPVPLNAQGFESWQAAGHPNWRAMNEDAPVHWGEQVSKDIIRVLINSESAPMGHVNRINTRGKVYINLESADQDGTLLDPWVTQYHIKLDRDFDGRVEFLSDPNQHRTRSVVVSAGRSREFFGGPNNINERDNIANVRLR